MDCPPIDISYCQNGIRWPGYRGVEEINRELKELGADRNGRYPWLYDSTRFFDQAAAWKRVRGVRGSMV